MTRPSTVHDVLIATDGVIRSGRSTLDLSAVTGSLGVEVEPGRDSFAAAINGGGAVDVEATATTDSNSLARVQAQERKGSSQRMAEG